MERADGWACAPGRTLGTGQQAGRRLHGCAAMHACGTPSRSTSLLRVPPAAGPIVAILCAYVLAFGLVAALSLKYINFQKR